MVKASKNIPEGSVVLIDKPVESPVQISQTMAYKSLPKRPLTEKQKENLTKLIDKNRTRWRTKKEAVVEAIPEVIPEEAPVTKISKKIRQLKETPIPEIVPDGKVLAIVKPKRKYTKRSIPIQNSIIMPQSESSQSDTQSESSEQSQSESESEPEYVAPKIKQQIAKKYYYASDTSETSDTDGDYHEQKYIGKTKKRLESLAEINARLRQIALHRTHHTHSIF